MNYFLFKLFELLPSKLKDILIKSNAFRFFRKRISGNKGNLREVTIDVIWNNNIQFKFCAPIKIAEKAKNRGIENTLLRNSLQLLDHTTDAIVFDVGCNYGFLSSVYALSAPVKKVYAFEPHPKVYKSFQKAISLNNLHEQIILNNLAIGAENTMLELFLYRTTSNTILRKNTNFQKHTVEQLTLDNFFKDNNIVRCDLIKIDVDGSEISVLQGAKQIILLYKPILIVETNDNTDIISFLSDLNYSVYDMKLQLLQAGKTAPNIFAIHQSAKREINTPSESTN